MVLSAIIGSLILALSGCSDQSGQTEKTLRVGVITYSQDDPFINALTDELKAHLKTMESEERRIIVSIKSGNDDQQEQNEKVEEMIDAGCDVPVSYTHLDVYKRQALHGWAGAGQKAEPGLSEYLHYALYRL